VKRILAGFLFSFYFVGLFQMSSALSFGGVTKIKMTHSHEATHSHGDHEHFHHDEGVTTSSSDHSDADKQTTHTPNGKTTHSHEIVVGSSAFCLSPPNVRLMSFEISSNVYPDRRETLPPRDPSLSSIFRPPIA
jgi:ABC-type Zn2+ transport system substrate-binding protein/surface adhesin